MHFILVQESIVCLRGRILFFFLGRLVGGPLLSPQRLAQPTPTIRKEASPTTSTLDAVYWPAHSFVQRSRVLPCAFVEIYQCAGTGATTSSPRGAEERSWAHKPLTTAAVETGRSGCRLKLQGTGQPEPCLRIHHLLFIKLLLHSQHRPTRLSRTSRNSGC